MATKERMTIHFSGTVQGVGFRYRTDCISIGRNVTGSVRNLRDGRVELVAEGTSEELTQFRTAIETSMRRYITTAEEQRQPATGEFHDFSISH